MNITPEQLAIINLISSVGINAAISIIEGLSKAKTNDEAIAALKASREITWADYKARP